MGFSSNLQGLVMIFVAATSSFSYIPPWPKNGRPPHSRELVTLNRVSNQREYGFVSITQDDRRRCELFNLSKRLVPYDDAWNWQKDIVREKRTFIERKEESPDTLIVLQHHPVYTLGTGSSVGYLNFDVEDAPYEVYRTERGGEVTYHGPGQGT